MLDSDIASFYVVETKQLNRQVRRNIESFSEDFMYVLTKEEHDVLRCQIGTLEGKGKYVKRIVFRPKRVRVVNKKIVVFTIHLPPPSKISLQKPPSLLYLFQVLGSEILPLVNSKTTV